MNTKIITGICIFFAFAKALSQQLNAPDIVNKAIMYHDPNGNWPTFQGEFTLALDMPGKPSRKSTITIDSPEQYFKLSVQQGKTITISEIKEDQCNLTNKDGKTITTKINDTQCERTSLFRNYYSYLYGLPMKLKDQGTHIDPKAERVTFKGKEYLKVRVTYDKNIGTDIWQFYFNPKTYAMEVYQFFKGGPDETTGEYILLSDIEIINEIKFPKNRAWYYNKDNSYLATDKIISK